MSAWTLGVNDDGLRIKFGTQEADKAAGGFSRTGGDHEYVEFDIDYTEVLSATDAIVGSVGNPGAFGVELPEGARLLKVETEVETAFTSSGTIGSATMLIGTKKSSDRSTELDHNGLLTASATGTALGLATVGTTTTIGVGDTGAGAQLGTTLAEDGVITASNSAHGSHPYTAGKLRVRVFYRVA